jgi:hypothetical protein
LAKNKYGLATILVPFLFNSGEQANICFSWRSAADWCRGSDVAATWRWFIIVSLLALTDRAMTSVRSWHSGEADKSTQLPGFCPGFHKTFFTEVRGTCRKQFCLFWLPRAVDLRHPAHRYHAVPSPGFKPTTLWLRVQRPNHSPTMPRIAGVPTLFQPNSSK